jgi:hypothetical protein
MNRTAIPYLVYMTDHVDEALSLAEYLNQHGVFAVQDECEVSCPLEEDGKASLIKTLYSSWTQFWEYSDKGLWGLPCYTKPGCGHHG